jgi:hypothetical protein
MLNPPGRAENGIAGEGWKWLKEGNSWGSSQTDPNVCAAGDALTSYSPIAHPASPYSRDAGVKVKVNPAKAIEQFERGACGLEVTFLFSQQLRYNSFHETSLAVS